MNIITQLGICLLFLVLAIGIGSRFNDIESNQNQIITNQEQIILLVSPRYSTDIENIDGMKILKPKVSK